jgi:hypothetical protein
MGLRLQLLLALAVLPEQQTVQVTMALTLPFLQSVRLVGAAAVLTLAPQEAVVPVEVVGQAIQVVRGLPVLLDRDMQAG